MALFTIPFSSREHFSYFPPSPCSCSPSICELLSFLPTVTVKLAGMLYQSEFLPLTVAVPNFYCAVVCSSLHA
ncbi:hypothetical protein VIGAN_11179900 [Vigna angularis var. angularis]|uniref:Uncharacterized protein n=1 Tax=Vigna angularis var. angularis TaxID=157739 RepID=A0A0S3TB76_PHAAN|nr:hypothetical protein VIGAN_11179900 [Vigna angularis var. angularis]